MSDKRAITKQGSIRAQKKLEELLLDQKKIVEDIKVARSYGDLRENAEYHNARERQNLIESQIASKVEVIENTIVLDYLKDANLKSVGFGATVTILIDGDREQKWQVVGPDEADSALQTISITSPIGRAIINKNKGDLVYANTPKGELEIEIIEIAYI